MEMDSSMQSSKGGTCANCSHFIPNPKTPNIGKCFGNELSASGSCSYYESK